MIAQGFGFTREFLKERNNPAYFRLKKIPCGFKEQARARHPGEICGLNQTPADGVGVVDYGQYRHQVKIEFFGERQRLFQV